MKALIFNSGRGTRLGRLTADKPKCMVRLKSGESIFHRQLRILFECGIREFVITTGPYAEQLIDEAASFEKQGCSIRFVPNPDYCKTNYIYSMHLAREHLVGDSFIMLHGDLVFDAAYAQLVIDSELESLGSVNTAIPLPEKDFKARISNGLISEVSVSIFEDDCVAFQPFYKLSQQAMSKWLDAVAGFVDAGNTSVYAENAANAIFGQMGVGALDYGGHLVEEVDTPDDLERVSGAIRLYDFEQQPVFELNGNILSCISGSPVGVIRGAKDVPRLLRALTVKNPLVVASSFFHSLNFAQLLESVGCQFGVFTDFEPNPTYEDVVSAMRAFRAGGHDSLISVGGGSAIDVAKCVKLLAACPDGEDRGSLTQKNACYSAVLHVAVPTTAGTGSESTHFAVCYIDGVKTSVASDFLQPDIALLDSSNLISLPDYQRKCTVLDALCQAIESYWSNRSSEQSRRYSSEAIRLIIQNINSYFYGVPSAMQLMMRAANLAGKAINLTTTTAPHAMSYKLTSLYGIPHGHAVAMCMPLCWRIAIDHGDDSLMIRLREIAELLCNDSSAIPEDGLDCFENMLRLMNISACVAGAEKDIRVLSESVNVQRLSNFPIALQANEIEEMYRSIVMVSK